MKTIGESAFDTSKLSGVDLANATKLESIGNSAFAFNRIKELSLPESLKSIGNQAFASNLLEAVTIPDTITSYGTDVFIYNGRYVMVTTNSDLVSTNNVEGKFGSIKNPVSFWLEGVDAESEKILSTEEIKNDPFTQKPTHQLLFKGNTIDLPAPPIKRYKSNEHIQLTLDQAFLTSNTKEHPIRVKYRAVLGGPVFHGLDTLEVTLGTPKDQVNVLQGVTATDVDGQNITANIVADPTEINTSVLGKTIVKLSVTDEAGYTAHATRMVMVVTDPWDTDLGKGWTMRDFEFNKQGLTKLSKLGLEKIKTNKNLVLPSFNPLYNERGAHDNITVIPQRLFANQQIQSVDLPEYLEEIKADAFSRNDITRINLPDTLKIIGPSAFQNNKLTSIELPESLTSLGVSSFQDNSIASLTIPSEITSLPDKVFSNNKISDLSLPDNLISIGKEAFKNNNLTSVAFPETTTLIDDFAFMSNSLERAPLNDGLQSIGRSAFELNKLASALIPQTVKKLGSGAFAKNTIQRYVIPDGTTEIPTRLFQNNNISDLVLPSSVSVIGDSAFENNRFRTVHIPETIKQIKNYAFNNNVYMKSVDFDEGVSSLGNSAFGNNALEMDELVLPHSITSMGTAVFSGDNQYKYQAKVKSLVLPPYITQVPDSAFESLLLKRVSWPSGLTSIGAKAFKNSNLGSVELPSGITKIGASAFENSNITSLKLPKSIKTIDNIAFSGNQLETIELPQGIEILGAAAFSSNRLRSVNFPDSLISLGANAFFNNLLTDVQLPNSIESIGNSAFSQNKISTLVLPHNPKLTDIPYSCFSSNLLNSVEIPDNITAISNNAFANNNLNNVKFPGNLTSIGSSAFTNNLLGAIHLPDSVKTIGANAFNNAGISGDFTLPAELSSLGDSAFFDNNISSLTVGPELKVIPSSAFYNNRNLAQVSINPASQLTEIKSNAFSNGRLQQIDLPATVTKIASNAFAGNLGWQPVPGVNVWPETSTPDSKGKAQFQDNKVRVSINKNGLPFNPKGLDSVSKTWALNSAVIEYKMVLKSTGETLSNVSYLEAELGTTKEITPRSNRFYHPVNANPISVKVDKPFTQVEVEYEAAPDFDPTRYVTNMYHLSGKKRSTGLLSKSMNSIGNPASFDFIVEVGNSGDAQALVEPWVIIDFNKPFPTNYLQSIEFKDGIGLGKQWFVQGGKLFIQLNGKLSSGNTKELKVRATFKNVPYVPDGEYVDLTKAVSLVADGTTILQNKESIGIRARGVQANAGLARGEYRVPSEQVQDKLYVPQGVDNIQTLSFAGKINKVDIDSYTLTTTIPTYNGLDSNGKPAKLTAQFDPNKNPGWILSGNTLTYTAVPLANTSSGSSTAAPNLVLSYPRAELNTSNKLSYSVEYMTAPPSYTYDSKLTDEQVQELIDKGVAPVPEPPISAIGSAQIKFLPLITPFVPTSLKPQLTVQKTVTGMFRDVDKNKSFYVAPGVITNTKDISFVNDGKTYSWSKVAPRTPAGVAAGGFFDTPENRKEEYVWAFPITASRIETLDGLSISDSSLDSRMYYTGISVPSTIPHMKVKAFDNKNATGKPIFEATVYPGRLDFPEQIRKSIERLDITMDTSLTLGVNRDSDLGMILLHTKFKDPSQPVYTFASGMGINSKKNQIANTATVSWYGTNKDNAKVNGRESVSDFMCAAPANQGSMSFQKTLVSDGEIIPGKSFAYKFTITAGKAKETQVTDFKIVDILPPLVEPSQVSFSDAFLQSTTNPRYEFVNNINGKGSWGVVISADSYNPTKLSAANPLNPIVTATDTFATIDCVADNFMRDGEFTNNAWMAFNSEALSTKLNQVTNAQTQGVTPSKLSDVAIKNSKAEDYLKPYGTNVTSSNASFKVLVSDEFSSYQSIRPDYGDPNTPWSTKGISVHGNQPFTYRLNFQRNERIIPERFEVMGTLPYNRDTRMQVNQEGIQVPRGTNLESTLPDGEPYSARVSMTGPIVCEVPEKQDLFEYYYAVADPETSYRDVLPDAVRDNVAWYTADQLPQKDGHPDWSKVTAYRIVAKDVRVALKDSQPLRFDVPMITPDNKGNSLDGHKAVSSFVRWVSNSTEERAFEVNNAWTQIDSSRIALNIRKTGHDGGAVGEKATYPLANVVFKLYKVYEPSLDQGKATSEFTMADGSKYTILKDPVSPDDVSLDSLDPADAENLVDHVQTNAAGVATYHALSATRNYILEESIPEGYLKTNQRTRLITGKWLEEHSNNSLHTATLNIVNEKEVKQSTVQPLKLNLRFNKVGFDGLALPFTRFTLTATSVTGFKVSREATAGVDGSVVFTDLPAFGALPNSAGQGKPYVLTESGPLGSLSPVPPIEIHFKLNKDSQGNLLPDSLYEYDAQGNITKVLAFGSNNIADGFYTINPVVNRKADLPVYKIGVYTNEDLKKGPARLSNKAGKRLEGVRLQLKDSTGKVIQTVTTNGQGKAVFKGLDLNTTYSIAEPEAPHGFKQPEKDIKVSIDKFGGITANDQVSNFTYLSIPNEPLNLTNIVTIFKTDEPNGKGRPIKGAEFALYRIDKDASGRETETLVAGPAQTDEFGQLSFQDFGIENPRTENEKLLAQTFELRETKPALGYINQFKPVRFMTSDKDVISIPIEAYNPLAIVSLSKHQKLKKEAPVPGAEFTLFASPDGTGVPLETQTTDKDGNLSFSFNKFDTTKQYSVVETKTPEGYRELPDAPVYIVDFPVLLRRVGFNGHYTIDATNELLQAKLVVVKRDSITGAPLENATFALFTKEPGPDGSETLTKIDEQVTDKTGIARFNQVNPYTSYVVKETKAPEGYQLASDQTIDIADAHTYYLGFEDYRTPVSVNFQKVLRLSDGEQSVESPLAQVKFTVAELVDGIPLKLSTVTKTTDADGNVSFDGLTIGSDYLVTEQANAVATDIAGLNGALSEGSWIMHIKDTGIGKDPIISFTPTNAESANKQATIEAVPGEDLSFKVLNRRIDPTPGSITVTKNFNGGDQLAGGTYKVKLYRQRTLTNDKELVATKELVQDSSYRDKTLKLTFENLAVDYIDFPTSSYKKWIYSIEEEIEGVPYRASFTPTISSDGIHGSFAHKVEAPRLDASITNTYTPATAKLAFDKLWKGSDKHPEIKVRLNRTVGEGAPEMVSEVDLPSGQTHIDFGSQPVTNQRGQVYTYSVEELNDQGQPLPPVGFSLNKIDSSWTPGKDSDNTEHTFKLENVYKAKGFAVLHFQKLLDGVKRGVSYNNANFTFILKAENSAEAPELARVTSTEAGDITFNKDGQIPALNFTGDDTGKTFSFYAFEVPSTDAGIVSDATAHKVEIAVSDKGDGTLSLDVSYPDGSDTFNNTHASTNATTTLKVKKTLLGRAWTDADVYNFVITPRAAEGEVALATEPQTVVLNKDSNGEVESHAFTFTQADLGGKTTARFGFDVSEVKPDPQVAGVSYDAHTAHVVVEVEDDLANAALKIKSVTYTNAGANEADASVTDAAAFTNTANPVTSSPNANISLVKELTGRALKANEFNFKLYASDADATKGNELQTVHNVDGGGFTFAGITFNTAGSYYYLVEEEAGSVAGVTYDTTSWLVKAEVTASSTDPSKLEVAWEVVSGKRGSDPVAVENKQAITLKNAYSATGSVELHFTKFLDGVKRGVSYANNPFSFTLADSADAGAKVLATATSTPAGDITFNADKSVAALNFNETNTGHTYTFYVREVASADAGIVSDATAHKVEITVSDKGDGTLSLNVSYPDGSDTFNNTHASQSASTTLKVKKTLLGRAWTDVDVYNFVITPRAAEGEVALATEPQTAVINKDSNGEVASKAFTFTQADLGGKTSARFGFDVSEVKPDPQVAGVSYDAHTAHVVVEVEDDLANAALKIKSVTYSNIGANDADASVTDAAAFTNTANPVTSSPNANISFTKELSGRALKANEFNFKLYASDADATKGKELQTVHNVDGGGFTFAGITFNTAGSYYYLVEEEAGSVAGVTYDTSSWLVKADVTAQAADPSTLEVAWEVVSGKRGHENIAVEDKHAIIFKNAYSATGSVELHFTKSLDGVKRGISYANNPFSFTLADSADAGAKVLATATSTPAGDIVFNADRSVAALNFNETNVGHTYAFYVREVASADAGIVSDATAHKVEITVSDKGDGTLSLDVSYPDGSDTFNNTHASTNATTTLKVKKTLLGRAWTDADVYNFVITPRAAEGELALVTEPQRVVINKDSNGEVESHAFTFTQADLGGKTTARFGFDVSEVKPDPQVAGVSYDAHTAHVVVEVEDDLANAALKIKSVTYTNAGANEADASVTDAAAFTNTANPVTSSPNANISLVKELTGRALKANEFNFKLYASDADATKGNELQTVHNVDGGGFTFAGITFNTAGSYYYLVEEEAGSLAGVTYDTTSWLVKAEVTADPKDASKLEVTWEVVSGKRGNENVAVENNKAITFKNAYRAFGSPVLIAHKLLDGKPAQATVEGQPFIFSLMNDKGQVLEQTQANSDGLIVFNTEKLISELGFDQDQVGQSFNYTIKEETLDDPTVTYDKTKFQVTITVKDDATRHLIFDIRYSDGTTAQYQNTEEGIEARRTYDKDFAQKLTKAATFQNTTVIPPSTPAEEKPNAHHNDKHGFAPKTGDTTVSIISTLMGLAGAAGFFLLRRKRKENH